MNIRYKINFKPDVDEIINLYLSSGIVRPLTDKKRIEKMYANSNLIITAWDNDLLVGVARSVTDFALCCYLSDLVVNSNYQCRGIGVALIEKTKEIIGENCSLLLLSAPSALSYYPKLGFEVIKNGFIIKRKG